MLAVRDTAEKALIDEGYSLSSAGVSDTDNAVVIGIVPEEYQSAADFVNATPELSALPLFIHSEERMLPITDSDKSTENDGEPAPVPVTGDDSRTIFWVVILFISTIALTGTAVFVPKRKRK